MTEDFTLFDDRDGDDTAAGADVELVTAYLAQELTLAQMAAVEERLATDAGFRDNAAPIIRAWVLPGAEPLSNADPLTRDEVDAGWRRYAASRVAPAPSTARGRQSLERQAADVSLVERKTSKWARIAAAIAVVVLPAFAFAQAVVYAADHPGVLGHALAVRIVASFGQRTPATAIKAATDDRPIRIDQRGRGTQLVLSDVPQQAVVPVGALRQDPLLTAVVDQRIDGVKHEIDGFGKILVAPNRSLVVPQPRQSQLWLFDSAGKRSAVFGRAGQGPGEFTRLGGNGIGWAGDTLWIYDAQQLRVSLFAPNGRFIATRRVMAPVIRAEDRGRFAPVRDFSVIGLLPGGAMIGNASLVDPPPRSSGKPRKPFIVVSGTGDLTRVLAWQPSTRDIMLEGRSGATVFAVEVPFSPEPYWDVSSTGAIIAQVLPVIETPTGGRVVVTVVGARGDTIYTRRIPFVGVPIPKRIADSVIQADADAARFPEQRSMILGDAATRMPRVYPPITGVVATQSGEVWIPFRADGAVREWLVLGAKGETVGRVRLPRDAYVSESVGGRVWAQVIDADGVPSIVRYRLERR